MKARQFFVVALLVLAVLSLGGACGYYFANQAPLTVLRLDSFYALMSLALIALAYWLFRITAPVAFCIMPFIYHAKASNHLNPRPVRIRDSRSVDLSAISRSLSCPRHPARC